jgi:hypothetical protein
MISYMTNFVITLNIIWLKTIAWMKKSGKGQQEWQKACEVVGLPSHKFNTSIKTCLKCFKNHPISRDFWIETCFCSLLWKTTIVDPTRLYAKSSNLDNSLGCCQYPIPCGSTMFVESIKDIGYFLMPLLSRYHLYVNYG